MDKPSVSVVPKEASQTLILSESLKFWFQRALIKGFPVKSLPDVGSSHNQVGRPILGKGMQLGGISAGYAFWMHFKKKERMRRRMGRRKRNGILIGLIIKM